MLPVRWTTSRAGRTELTCTVYHLIPTSPKPFYQLMLHRHVLHHVPSSTTDLYRYRPQTSVPLSYHHHHSNGLDNIHPLNSLEIFYFDFGRLSYFTLNVFSLKLLITFTISPFIFTQEEFIFLITSQEQGRKKK